MALPELAICISVFLPAFIDAKSMSLSLYRHLLESSPIPSPIILETGAMLPSNSLSAFFAATILIVDLFGTLQTSTKQPKFSL